MAKPKANLRLFVAIHPPEESVRAMFAAMSDLELPPHRLMPPEQVHLTLQFVGDTPVAELDGVIESVRRAGAGLSSFSLTPQRLCTLPERGPARLIAVETDPHPTVMELHRRLVTRLAANVRSRDRERFFPHLTLTRFRSPASGVRIQRILDLPQFAVNRITLWRSVLGPQGATHHEVAACDLDRTLAEKE